MFPSKQSFLNLMKLIKILLSFFVGYFMVCYTFTERCILYYIVVRNILNLIMVVEYM